MPIEQDPIQPQTWKDVAAEADRILRNVGGGRSRSHGPDWSRISASRLRRLAGASTGAGDALFIANSSDGGVYAPVIYRGRERLKGYFRHDVDLEAWLDRWSDYYEK